MSTEEKEEFVTIQVLPGSEVIPPNGIRNMDAIKEKAEHAFLGIKDSILKECAIVENVNIVDASSCNTAQQLAIRLNKFLTAIENKRKELKKPSMDEGAIIDSIAKLITVPAKKAIDVCKSKIKSYDDSLKKEELKQSNEEIAIPQSSVTKRTVWKFEIEAQCAIPKEWLMLDEAKVKEWMKDRNIADGQIINGVKFTKDSIVILR